MRWHQENQIILFDIRIKSENNASVQQFKINKACIMTFSVRLGWITK
jgi:BarA-like signal transduction histidine kinase